MLFKFNFEKELEESNLNNLSKNISYYVSMMHILNINELKYNFYFSLCNCTITIEKLDNESYSINLYSYNNYTSLNIVEDAFKSIFQSIQYKNINVIINDICQMLKIIYKFNKLKVFV